MNLPQYRFLRADTGSLKVAIESAIANLKTHIKIVDDDFNRRREERQRIKSLRSVFDIRKWLFNIDINHFEISDKEGWDQALRKDSLARLKQIDAALQLQPTEVVLTQREVGTINHYK